MIFLRTVESIGKLPAAASSISMAALTRRTARSRLGVVLTASPPMHASCVPPSWLHSREHFHILSTANDRVVLEVASAKKHSAVRGVDKSRGMLATLAGTIGVRRALTGHADAADAMLHWGVGSFNTHAHSPSNVPTPVARALIPFVLIASPKLFRLNCELLDEGDDCDQSGPAKLRELACSYCVHTLVSRGLYESRRCDLSEIPVDPILMLCHGAPALLRALARRSRPRHHCLATAHPNPRWDRSALRYCALG